MFNFQMFSHLEAGTLLRDSNPRWKRELLASSPRETRCVQPGGTRLSTKTDTRTARWIVTARQARGSSSFFLFFPPPGYPPPVVPMTPLQVGRVPNVDQSPTGHRSADVRERLLPACSLPYCFLYRRHGAS